MVDKTHADESIMLMDLSLGRYLQCTFWYCNCHLVNAITHIRLIFKLTVIAYLMKKIVFYHCNGSKEVLCNIFCNTMFLLSEMNRSCVFCWFRYIYLFLWLIMYLSVMLLLLLLLLLLLMVSLIIIIIIVLSFL